MNNLETLNKVMVHKRHCQQAFTGFEIFQICGYLFNNLTYSKVPNTSMSETCMHLHHEAGGR